MTTKVLTIIFAILAGVSDAYQPDLRLGPHDKPRTACFGGILFGYILLAVGVKKDRKELVNVALKMKEIGVGICSKAFILTFIFLFLMSK